MTKTFVFFTPIRHLEANFALWEFLLHPLRPLKQQQRPLSWLHKDPSLIIQTHISSWKHPEMPLKKQIQPRERADYGSEKKVDGGKSRHVSHVASLCHHRCLSVRVLYGALAWGFGVTAGGRVSAVVTVVVGPAR